MEHYIILPEDMRVSEWSGGTTTEIAIFPKDAVYADRDFIWRISTARVNAAESDFTPLPDYDRIIASIEGEMRLTHLENGGAREADIIPRETVHRFDGGAATHCVGKAVDLNLMLRKGKAVGRLEFIKKGGTVTLSLSPGETAAIFDLSKRSAEICECGASDERSEFTFCAEADCALFVITENNCVK